jgi:co-chaperonin GroES (HSP10)
MTQTNSIITIPQPNREEALLEAFPAIACPVKPLGNRVVVQIRLPKTKTKSGLHITSNDVENLYRNEQTAKVVAIGSGAFIFPTTGQPWPSGDWFKVGDYVRAPLHGGDNHWIPTQDNQLVLFKTFKDYEIIGLIEGDPLEVKTVIAYF